MKSFPFITALSAFLLLSDSLAAPALLPRNCTYPRPRQTPLKQSSDLSVVLALPPDKELLNCSDHNNITGFLVDVFELALGAANPDAIHMTIHYYRSGLLLRNCTGEMMKNAMEKGSYHAVVGGNTISASRLASVDFSQPYIESGIVGLTRAINQGYPSALTFLQPFTVRMWVTSLGAFFTTAIMLWVLERKNQPEFNVGSLSQRTQAVCRFVGSSLILMERDNVTSRIAKLLMVSWTIFGFLLGSSYVAGLSSYLTAAQLSLAVNDIHSVLSGNYTIGYREKSIVGEFLVKRLNIPQNRLQTLRTFNDFERFLSKEASQRAIFEEAPYVDLFLSQFSTSKCIYQAIGPKLTTEGFGFAFPHGSTLALNISRGILKLSEEGCLQDLQKEANLSPFHCDLSTYSSQITLKSSLSLFILLGGEFLTCLTIHYAKR